MTELSIAEYARHRKANGLSGGTYPAIEKAIATGRIECSTDGKINPAVADMQWRQNTRKKIDLHRDSTDEPAEPIKVLSWAEAKARNEHAQAQLTEIKLAKQKGELIDRTGYERGARQTGRMLRDALVTTLPAKLALELATITDPWQIECALREAVRAELHALCDGLDAEIADASG